MFIAIGTFLGGLVGKSNIGQGAARIIGIAVLVVGLVAVLGVAKCSYDRSVIEQHEARQEAATVKADRKADQNAAETRREDDARQDTEEDQLREIQNDATLTPAQRRLARQRCIRVQQSARAEGREPPACG